MSTSTEEEEWSAQWIRSTKQSILKLKPEEVSQKRKIYGYTHALLMLFCFGVVLATIYSQQEPSRYTTSYAALKDAVNFDLAEIAVTRNDIWAWFRVLIRSIGGKTIDHIRVNCQYKVPYIQNVSIEGKSYGIYNPELQFQSCEESHMAYINELKREVYLTGNHEILSFGVFTERSVPHSPIKSSTAQDTMVRSNEVHPLNPVRDNKIIQTCRAPWGNQCLLRDGFKGEPGSTLGWTGKKINDLYVYEMQTSFSYFFSEGANPFILYPCYGYHNASKAQVVPTPPWQEHDREGRNQDKNPFPAGVVPGYADYNGTAAEMVLEDCEDYTWVTNGYDIRVECMKLYDQQPTPTQAFIARYNGYDNVKRMFNELLGCDMILDWDPVDLRRVFVNAQRSLEASLDTEGSHGLFFDTSDQQAWIADSINGELLLKAHAYMDSNTRVFRTYAVTRGLGKDELFYSMVIAEFFLESNGNIEFEEDVTFVPIMQYWYGTDGYEWRVTDVFMSEILLLSIAALFTLRELYQLYEKRISKFIDHVRSKYSTPPVRPTKTVMIASTIQVPVRPPHPTPMTNVPVKLKKNVCDVERFESVGSSDTDRGVTTFVLPKPGWEVERLESVGSYDCERGGKTFVKKTSKLPMRMGASSRAISSINEMVTEVDTTIATALSNLADLTPDEDERHDLLDWMTIIIICVVATYRVQYVMGAMDLHEMVLGLDSAGEGYDGHLESMILRFRELRVEQRICRYLMIALLFVTVMQFFRYMAFDKKLGIVTSTISSAGSDLIPVLVIFFVVLCAYSVLGTQIYGVELQEFCTLGESMASLLVMLLGEYMRDVSPIETYIFFFSFVILVVFILLNMVLAVIFTVYDEKYQENKRVMSAEKKE